MPFLAAGHPTLEVTRQLLEKLPEQGADLIEVGIPFSDPIADGPVIQAAFNEALKHGLKVDDVLQCVADARDNCSAALLAMVSYSLVYKRTPETFFKDAAAAGFDGLIIPDLPPQEARTVCNKAWECKLDTTLLVSPTTREQRYKEISELSSGFVYYMSVAGITGERKAIPSDLQANVAKLKSQSNVPVCVGFGISSAEHVNNLKGTADGAIVGSALVRRLSAANQSTESAVNAGCTFVKELSAGV